jgi:hypothetical protein
MTEPATSDDRVSGKPLPEVIPLDTVRAGLATIWFVGALATTLILVLQSLLGKFGDEVQEAWGWLLPTIMPTLGMILAVLSYTALNPAALDAVVRRSFYRIAKWLSIFYLGLVALTLLIQPFSTKGPLELVRMSNLWLGPMQGLVGTSLGVLFV